MLFSAFKGVISLASFQPVIAHKLRYSNLWSRRGLLVKAWITLGQNGNTLWKLWIYFLNPFRFLFWKTFVWKIGGSSYYSTASTSHDMTQPADSIHLITPRHMSTTAIHFNDMVHLAVDMQTKNRERDDKALANASQHRDNLSVLLKVECSHMVSQHNLAGYGTSRKSVYDNQGTYVPSTLASTSTSGGDHNFPRSQFCKKLRT
jgi:hypothetical protein